jgi:hypothetical protein
MNPRYWDEPSNPNRPVTFEDKARRLREFLFG